MNLTAKEVGSSTNGRRRLDWPELVRASMIILGLSNMIGWMLHLRWVVSTLGMLPMVFNTGLCFCVLGIAFSRLHCQDNSSQRWRTALATLVMVLCIATLVEIASGKSLGIDLAFLQSWYDYGNVHTGRMAPNTAIGFILICAALILADRVTTKARAVVSVVLTFTILAIGLVGIVGFALAPDLLFEWARSARMAIPTAIGMILCSIALRYSWSKSHWYVSQTYFREDRKLLLLGPATLAVVVLTAGIAGFISLQNVMDNQLAKIMEDARQSQIAILTDAATRAAQSASLDRLPGLSAASIDLLSASDAANADRIVEAEMVKANLRGVAVENASGATVKRFGKLNPVPPIIASLSAGGTELLWDTELAFRIRSPLVYNGKHVGFLVQDRPATELERALFDVRRLGTTAEVAICETRQPVLECFPGRRHSVPFVIVPHIGAYDMLPVQRAVSGEAGHVISLDYWGHNVLAAYALLAPGVGIVVKEDTRELYLPIRDALILGVPLLVFIAMLGAWLLYLQSRPLTAQMLAAEGRATEKALLVRTVIGIIDEGILTIDHSGLILDINPSACDTFGYTSDELIGIHTKMLLLEGGRGAEHGRLNHELRRGFADLAGQRNIKLSGRKKDGSEFPLEVTITEMNSAGKQLFVGVVRDITERTEAERKLTALGQYDSLTALPNRSLFLVRLSKAPDRLRESGKAFAVAFIDIDGFKEVNDTHGHRGGDDVLIQVAQRLTSAVRDSDTVARLAGDEFTIILEGLVDPVQDARRVAGNIIASLNKPFLVAGRELKVTASIGLVIQADYVCDTTDLLGRADAAMYSAKQSGKNRVKIDAGAIDDPSAWEDSQMLRAVRV